MTDVSDDQFANLLTGLTGRLPKHELELGIRYIDIFKKEHEYTGTVKLHCNLVLTDNCQDSNR